MNLYDTDACVTFAIMLARSSIYYGEPSFFRGVLGQSVCEYLGRDGATERAMRLAEERRLRLRKRVYQMELWEGE